MRIKMKKKAYAISIQDLENVHLDALQEICNIGMGHAATALSQMIASPIDLNVPKVHLAKLGQVPEIIGGAEQVVVGIYLQVWGEVQGNILLVFPRESAQALGNLLAGETQPHETGLTEMHASLLKEIGNILAGSYLSTMEQLLKITLVPSVPSLAFDMAGAIVDYILIQLGRKTDITIVIETEFHARENQEAPDKKIIGRFFLLPDPQSLELILRASRVLKSEESEGGIS
jgi:chemotaxis protein CheC